MKNPYTRLSYLLYLLVPALIAAPASADSIYQVNPLASDLVGAAPHLDANLTNPWGIDRGPTSPFWISNNATGTSTLYSGGTQQGLVVTVPGAPTGVVFNSTRSFGGNHFIFASEDGTISGWSSGTSAVVHVDNSATKAVYKGIALASLPIGNLGQVPLMYATNFHSGSVDVFAPDYTPVGSFTDSALTAQGYAPFNVANIGDQLYVTFAKQDADKHDDVAGSGNGFIDIFNADGSMVRRFASNGALNSPWGMAVVPAGFGLPAGDILVGNFGDGKINVFDPAGNDVGQLQGKNGPIDILGLWGLRFGNGAAAGPADALFFTAGIPGPGGEVEDHGLFGSLTVVPEPSSWLLLCAGLAAVTLLRLQRRTRT
jgi:uncharacterized protein (TIGR03118 family)